MSVPSLQKIESSIARLDLSDQVRLLQYLAPKIADAVLSRAESDGVGNTEEAVGRYFALGDQLAATSVAGSPSLTDAISQRRR